MPILLPEERLGRHVGNRYRLDAILSKGGMGVLFEGFDEATGRRVAIKMLKPAYALEPDGVARFLRETRIAVLLRHPNIAAVLNVGTDAAGVTFLIMELLKGRSLAEELEARGTLTIGEALAIMLPVARALAVAHAMGIVHRDIKPGNIFLCRGSRGDSCDEADGAVTPKLLDFGIAKTAQDDFETQTGMVLGTPGYMAPEQAQYGECGPFTDIWGVGAVLYRCLMGHPPHAGHSIPEILRRLTREPVEPVVALGASKSVCATIDRALALDPHRRYESMGAFARALGTAAARGDQEPTTEVVPISEPPTRESDPPPIAPPHRGRTSLRGPALLTAALVAAGLLFVARKSEEARHLGVAKESPATSRERATLPDSIPTRKPSSPSEPEISRVARAPELPTKAFSRTSATVGGALPLSASGSRRSSTPRPSSPPTTSSPNQDMEREATTGLPIIVQW